MIWTQMDDGLNSGPQAMPDTVSNAALDLRIRLCVHTAYQLRFPAFDGAFDLTMARSLKGNTRQVTGLEIAGMFGPALAADRWMAVEADTLMKFGDISGSELEEKGTKAGHVGGVASGGIRRGRTKQLLQANHETKPK